MKNKWMIFSAFSMALFFADILQVHAKENSDNHSYRLYEIFQAIKKTPKLSDAQMQEYQKQLKGLLPNQFMTVEDFLLIYPHSEFYKKIIESKIRQVLATSNVSRLRHFTGGKESPLFFIRMILAREMDRLI